MEPQQKQQEEKLFSSSAEKTEGAGTGGRKFKANKTLDEKKTEISFREMGGRRGRGGGGGEETSIRKWGSNFRSVS